MHRGGSHVGWGVVVGELALAFFTEPSLNAAVAAIFDSLLRAAEFALDGGFLGLRTFAAFSGHWFTRSGYVVTRRRIIQLSLHVNH